MLKVAIWNSYLSRSDPKVAFNKGRALLYLQARSCILADPLADCNPPCHIPDAPEGPPTQETEEKLQGGKFSIIPWLSLNFVHLNFEHAWAVCSSFEFFQFLWSFSPLHFLFVCVCVCVRKCMHTYSHAHIDRKAQRKHPLYDCDCIKTLVYELFYQYAGIQECEPPMNASTCPEESLPPPKHEGKGSGPETKGPPREDHRGEGNVDA